MPRHLLISTVAFGLTATLALPAAAQSSSLSGVTATGRAPAGRDIQMKAVHFADIDPTTADGAHRLLIRVSRAAEDVCSPGPMANIKNLQEFDDYRDFERCKVDGIRLALSEVNTPAVSALLTTVVR